jgi:hypothetical protein
MAPEEYKWEKLFPFFYAKGSTVFILVSLVDGNYVKPVFLAGICSSLWTILIPGFGMDIGLTVGLFASVVGLGMFFCMNVGSRIITILKEMFESIEDNVSN